MEVLAELPLDHEKPFVARAERGELVMLPIEHLGDLAFRARKHVTPDEMIETSPEPRDDDDELSFSDPLSSHQAVFDHGAEHAADDFVADTERASQASLPNETAENSAVMTSTDRHDHVEARGCDAKGT